MHEPKVPRWCRSYWDLFTDWCAAFDYPSLPAHPVTLARFLHAHPAADTTQVHRIGVINTVHRANGHQRPGRAQAIRDLLNPPTPTELATAAARASAAEHALLKVPTSGWPSGLYGRRDALMLVLSCYADLTYTDISTLQRSHVSFEHGVVFIGAGHDVALTVRPDPRTCPVAIYLRWARLQAHYDRYPSNFLLRRALTRATPVTAHTETGMHPLPALAPLKDGPLITGFDQWGHHASRRPDRRGVHPRAIGRTVTAHLSGTARLRTDVPAPPDPVAPAPAPVPVVPELSSEELARRYEDGIGSRRRGLANLEEVDYEALDAETEALLQRTIALLELAQRD